MNKSESRLAANIPANLHTQLKHIAVYYHTTVTDLVVEALQNHIDILRKNEPNALTLETMRKVEKGEDITSYDSLDAMFKDLGLK